MEKIKKENKIILFIKEIFDRFKESIISVLPIMAIVGVLFGVQYIYLNNETLTKEVFSLSQLLIFILCGVILSIGIAIFSLGADLSMTPIGKYVGEDLTKRKSLVLMGIVGLLLGTLITIAEPDLTVLSEYVPSDIVSPWVIKISVAIGVGIFLVIGIFRIIFSKSIKLWTATAFLIIFGIACLYGDGDNAFLELSFDCAGVTTGQITVPFLVSFGIGLAGVKGSSSSSDDSFGLSGLCSIGPVIVVLLLGLIIKPEGLKATNDVVTLTEAIISSLKDVGLAIAPVMIFFILYDLLFLKLKKNDLIRIFIGFLYTYIGLVIFLSSANYGFIPVGKAIGEGYLNIEYILIIASILFGAVIVLAEPSVHILNAQVEELSNGLIKKKTMLIGLSIGVSSGVLLSVLRVLYFPNVSIMYIFVIGYALIFIFALFVDDLYVAIALDSGGIACGSMASAFIMPFIMGISLNSKVPSNGFGVIGIISMMPVLSIEAIGIISKINNAIANKRARERVREASDMELIKF